MSNKLLPILPLALFVAFGAQQTFGSIIVKDTWIDNTRNDPTPANNYSENGVDLDADGDIEAAWFKGPIASTVTMINPNPGVTPGIMRASLPASGSMSLTSYFTPVALAPSPFRQRDNRSKSPGNSRPLVSTPPLPARACVSDW